MKFTGEIQRIAEENTLQIWLDSYDDMFSDFDPRPYSKRMWSDDFFTQIRMMVKDHSKKVAILRILIPVKEKKEDIDKILENRLSLFISHRKEEVLKERKKAVYNGIYYILLGTFVMLVTEYINLKYRDEFSWHFLLQVFEPLGWFLLWMGLDKIVDSRKTIHDLRFFTKLANARIEFTIY